ncbi:hypothetical protein M405DRAFT_92713 [Rhizopogon salebrosus TDB-379]|nr:hypothetical protein M405DRAFT_92713 [Rhizopogon salebrosus TDB-379]
MRAKDGSSKNTPTNCEGPHYRTPRSSHLPPLQAALSTAPCSHLLGTPPVSQLPLVHQHPSCLTQDRSSKNMPTNCPSAPAATRTRNQRQRQRRHRLIGPFQQEYAYQLPVSTSRNQHPKPTPTPTPTHSSTFPKPIASLTRTITMQPYYNIARLALIGAGTRPQL